MRYEFIEHNLKDLQGKILTVIDAALDGEKNEAVKNIINDRFGDKFQWLYEVATMDTGEIDQSWEHDTVEVPDDLK